MKKAVLSARIVVLFGGAFLLSFIPETYPDVFGDWMCKPTRLVPCHYWDGSIDGHVIPELHWGYRHYLFFTMGLVLFIIQAVSIFNDENK